MAVAAAGTDRSRPGRRPAHKVSTAAPDRETRTRLLEHARTLFAAQGFRNVTVREICRAANANVAAINYHFGDKQGLYRMLIDEAIDIMRQTSEQAEVAGAGGNAEQRLRAFIRVFLQRVGSKSAPWIHQLMAHELAEPTEALDDVITQVIEPRIRYISALVADILGAEIDDERVMRCVLSVQSQFHAASANPVSKRLVPGFHGDPASVDRLAQHIADFSIAGIRSLRHL